MPAWHVYVIRSDRVDAISAALTQAGIGNRVYYRPALHRHPAMRAFDDRGDLPVTDALAGSHLALPIGPALGEPEAAAVTRTVAQACR
jgi:dTDP-4-amino-4,6-dideoxygalactose transaminase